MRKHTHTSRVCLQSEGTGKYTMSLLRLDPNPCPNTEIPSPREATSFISSWNSLWSVVPLALTLKSSSKVMLTPKTHDRHSHTRRQEVEVGQWLERRTWDRKVPGWSPCMSCRRIFFSKINFLADSGLFRYSFDPRVTSVARKRSQPFCQKCRWQDTAKHTSTHIHPTYVGLDEVTL